MPTAPSVVLATAGYDHTVRFWEARHGALLPGSRCTCAATRFAWPMAAFEPCADSRPSLFPLARQATSGICYRTLQYADSQVNKLEITPDKHYLAGVPPLLSNPIARQGG